MSKFNYPTKTLSLLVLQIEKLINFILIVMSNKLYHF